MLVAPSLLSSDFSRFADEIAMLNNSEADWIHLDVMDGIFVPNITFGVPVIKSVKKIATKPLDAHLMIIQPERYIKDFADAGADILSVHYEACTHLNRTINQIKEHGMKAGVVLNPHTNVDLLTDIINDVDLVLIMSVNPGFGGQKFIENSYSKISRLRELIIAKNSKALIEVDGGVSTDNAHNLHKAGADILVAGKAIFSSENPAATISQLKHIN